MATKYIIFRAVDDSQDSLVAPYSTRKTYRGGSAGDGDVIEVQVRDVTEEERSLLRSDRRIAGVGPAEMSLSIIEPFSTDQPRPLSDSEALPPSWGVSAVKAETSSFDGKGVTVAVLDTGIDTKHPAFSGRNVKLVTRNFVGTDEEGDPNGHGTHCAGTIFGNDVNGRRIGIARGIERALIGKVVGKGTGSVESLIHGIAWAVEQGADIISMSLGIDFPRYAERLQNEKRYPPDIATSRALTDYYDTVRLFEHLSTFVSSRAQRNGRSVLLVAAAGNGSRRNEHNDWTVGVGPPASAEGIIAVGALRGANSDRLDVADFSNTGPTLAAPGVDIVSAWPNSRLRCMSGTSMAAPHVTGVAALWGEKCMHTRDCFDAEWVRAQLIASSRHLSLPTVSVGSGIVQAPQE